LDVSTHSKGSDVHYEILLESTISSLEVRFQNTR